VFRSPGVFSLSESCGCDRDPCGKTDSSVDLGLGEGEDGDEDEDEDGGEVVGVETVSGIWDPDE